MTAGTPDTNGLSVLIPTRDRCESLARTLDVYRDQLAALPGPFEVMVVDDGSADGTPDLLASYDPRGAFELVHRRHPAGRGPAAARNTGLDALRGHLVLITGDDIVPAPGMVDRHLAWHRRYPEVGTALLGRVTWPDAWQDRPFLGWLERGGRGFYFNFRDLAGQARVSGEYFYTCNVSLKRALMDAAGRFDESFPFASHEDLEYGLRLQAAGMELAYDPEVLAYHWHELTLRGTVQRIYRMGYSAPLYWSKAGTRPGRTAARLRRVLARTARLPGIDALLLAACRRAGEEYAERPLRWKTLLHMAYWRGFGDQVAAGRPVLLDRLDTGKEP